MCDLQFLLKISGSCDIISVGSNGLWGFEEAIFAKTACRVHTFDCTGNFPAPHSIKSRVFSYHKCIGHLPGNPDYISYNEMLVLAGIRSAPAFLKIDVEGFEWNIFPGMLSAAQAHLLPLQIGFEIHQHALASGLGWRRNGKTIEEIALFGEMLFRAGYLVLHRRDNLYGVYGEACEFLIAKVYIPQV